MGLPAVTSRHRAWSGFGRQTCSRVALPSPVACDNPGIYNLMEGAPDIFVSGINIGANAGLGFFMA
ncbi:MAG: hypothetical protein FJ194_01540 [Gammaproteobacteria bacterium]|nr:hypothetical protein [Gammaproteobacteria bacterium]